MPATGVVAVGVVVVVVVVVGFGLQQLKVLLSLLVKLSSLYHSGHVQFVWSVRSLSYSEHEFSMVVDEEFDWD